MYDAGFHPYCRLGMAVLLMTLMNSVSGCGSTSKTDEPGKVRIDPVAAERLVWERLAREPRVSRATKMTPPLPCSWPPSGDGCVEYCFYRSTPTSTGIIRQKVYSFSYIAKLKVNVTKPDIALSKIADSRQLGQPQVLLETDSTDLATMQYAKEIMYRLVTQNQPPQDSLRNTLRPYLKFLKKKPFLGREWRLRALEFFAWLEHEPKSVD